MDFEDSIDWSTKFPNTKFHGLPELQYNDARTAVVVVIEALGVLAGAFGEILFATITRPKVRAKLLGLEAVKDLNAIDEWVERYWDA